MEGPSSTASVLTIDLEPPVTGRYITLQNFGNASAVSELQISELQVYGIPAGMVRSTFLQPGWITSRLWLGWSSNISPRKHSPFSDCSLLQYGATYGNDSAALATSTQPDAGACCQACYVNSICIHWDFELGSRVCRLRGDRSVSSAAASLLTVKREDGRVAGSRNGVSTYVTHPRYSTASAGSGFVTDTYARWISSLPTAFVPFGNRVLASAWVYTTFYKTLLAPPAAGVDPITGQQPSTLLVTLTVVADDEAVVLVNGLQVGQTAGSLVQTVLQFKLQAGSRNLIVLQCGGTGGPAVVVASLAGPDGSVLARTDHTWLWL
ncbi:hypothetical protein PLESTB_001769500 [Pleodorina starrii]|uniref:F5/8 type C domain-containing protein n=1 Tax=Pleodorina starrii TaxID=330485 RepID=A0A9W6F9S1_9CHLO|nr:hypothetical protein PLESTM_001864800 [Pleodorina starrii]GLC61558.1 hypothetical protein PLESTB_001769500 [Pleodorina starrii]GLC76836.1 hypothetical protein PLESTF_001846300 [Pleodorina starrii]